MHLATWILLGVLCASFFTIGTMVLVLPRNTFMHKMGVRADWGDAVPTKMYKLSGVLEIVGALGLVLPVTTGIATRLTAVAAIFLIVLMSIAIGVHIGISDKGWSVVKPVVLLFLLIFFLALMKNTGI